MPRFRPAFLSDVSAGRLGGSAGRAGHALDVQVLDADQVEPARQVGSGLLSPVLAHVRLTRFQLRDGQLDPGRAGRAALSSCQLALEAADAALPGGLSAGALSISPVDSATLTVTPRSTPATGRCRARGPVRGSRRRRHASARPCPWSPGRTSRLAAADGTSGIVPTLPSVSAPRHVAGQAAHIPLMPALPDDPESFVPPGLAPGRPPGRVAPVEERGPRVGVVPQRLLLHHLRSRSQPRVPGACLGELAALLQVTRRAHGGRGASARAAPRPGSRRTGRGRSGPASPLPGRAWGAAGT